MTRLDPVAAALDVKRTATLLRDARSVLRRLDVLAAIALAVDDPSVPLIAEARAAVERVVDHLVRQQAVQQRQARQAVRRVR